jgi:hypothetical protein
MEISTLPRPDVRTLQSLERSDHESPDRIFFKLSGVFKKRLNSPAMLHRNRLTNSAESTLHHLHEILQQKTNKVRNGRLPL